MNEVYVVKVSLVEVKREEVLVQSERCIDFCFKFDFCLFIFFLNQNVFVCLFDLCL